MSLLATLHAWQFKSGYCHTNCTLQHHNNNTSTNPETCRVSAAGVPFRTVSRLAIAPLDERRFTPSVCTSGKDLGTVTVAVVARGYDMVTRQTIAMNIFAIIAEMNSLLGVPAVVISTHCIGITQKQLLMPIVIERVAGT